MVELDFRLKPAYKKPRRMFRSKYDDIINEFLGCTDTIAEVRYDGISPHSVRLQLSNRIKTRKLDNKLKVYVKKGLVLLEKSNESGYLIYLREF